MNFPAIADEKDFIQHFQNEIWLTAAEGVCQRHGISYQFLQRAESGEHIVFLVDNRLTIKIYKPFAAVFGARKPDSNSRAEKRVCRFLKFYLKARLKCSITWS